MHTFSARLRAALWWLLPLAALAATIGWETDWGRAVETRPPPPEAIAPKPVAVSVLPEYAIAGGMAARTETVARTLFNPTRRPAPLVVQEVAQAKMQRGQFSLTGTTIANGKNTAFLREATGKSRRVQAGDSINGINVAEVKADRVRLTLGDESEELVLKVAGNPRPTPQPALAALGSVPQPVPVPGTAQTTPPPAVAAAPQDLQSIVERSRAARLAATPPAGTATPAPPPAATPSAAAGAATVAPTTPGPRREGSTSVKQ